MCLIKGAFVGEKNFDTVRFLSLILIQGVQLKEEPAHTCSIHCRESNVAGFWTVERTTTVVA
jgi:hypothetical protein